MEKVFKCFDAGKNQITHKIYFNMEEYCKQKSLELKALKVKFNISKISNTLRKISNTLTMMVPEGALTAQVGLVV